MTIDVKQGIKTVASRARSLAQGDAVDSRFFKRHFFTTAFVIISCLAFIAARFQNATAETTIVQLKKQIGVAATNKQKERSHYMTLTRESAMMHLVDSLNLGLTVPDARPVTLTLDN